MSSSASSSNSNNWRKTGGVAHAADQSTFKDLVTDTLTVKSPILGDLSISGTIYADNIVAVSSGSLISDDLVVQQTLTVQGNTQLQSLGVSGSLAVLDDAFVQDRLYLGPVVSAGPPPSSTSTQFLWSDGQTGIAVGAANFASPLPATLFLSGANPNALVATTSANAGRNILAQTGPRKSGLAVETAGGALPNGTGTTSLQFYDGSSASSASNGGDGLSAVDDPSGSAGNTAGLTFGAGTLTVSARNLVLDGSTVALSRNTEQLFATETRTAAAAAQNNGVPAALVVQSRPPVLGVSPELPAYNEHFLAGRLRAAPNNDNTGSNDTGDAGAVPVLAGAPFLLRAPDANGPAHAWAGSGDGTTGWRYGGGGPALDDLDPTRAGFLARPDPTLLPTVGRTMEPLSSATYSGPSSFSGNKRSAAQAGFLEPDLGRGGNAQFVPTLTQTQAPNRLQNRALVAVNAPLAPAHNQRAFLANGPSQIQMLDASPLSLALPFVATTPRATWDTVLLPDDAYSASNGRFGIVVGGRPGTGTGSDDVYPAYRTEDGGQTWAQSTIPVDAGVNVHFTPVVYGPNSVFVYATQSVAFFSTNRGRTWTRSSAMTGGDLAQQPYAYILPGTNQLFYTKASTLYLNPDLTASSANTTRSMPFTATGLAGVVVSGIGGVGTVAANLIAFSSGRSVLHCTRPAFGTSFVNYTSPNIADATGGYFGVAASTLPGRGGDVVAVGVGTSINPLVTGRVMIVTLSSDGGLSWPVEFIVPLGATTGPSAPTPATFSPAAAVTWLHPSVIVVCDAATTGNLAVSADRGRTWRFLSAQNYAAVTANGLGAVLGPRAALPLFCGVFRSTDLPHTSGGGGGNGNSCLPPAVLLATNSPTPASSLPARTAAFALSLDSLAPEWSPLLNVAGSASVEGHMDVDFDLGVGGDATVAQTLYCNAMDVVPDNNSSSSSSAVLSIGASTVGGPPKTVVIGQPGDTILLQGNVLQQSNVDVSGKVLTLNAANSINNSAFGVGIQAFENGVDAAGFVRTGGTDRRGWDFKAPGSTTVARLAVADLPAAPADAMLLLWSSESSGTVSGALTVGPAGGGGGPAGTTGMVLAKNLLRRNAALSTDNTALQAIDTSLAILGNPATLYLSAPTVSAATVSGTMARFSSSVSAATVSGGTVTAGTGGVVVAAGGTVSAPTISAGLVSATNVNVTTSVVVAAGAGGLVSAPLVSATNVSATNVSAGTVSATLVSATSSQFTSSVTVVAAGTGFVSAPVVSATSIKAGTGGVVVGTGGTVSAPLVSAATVSAGSIAVGVGGTITAPLVSAPNVSATNISAGTVSATLVSATSSQFTNSVTVVAAGTGFVSAPVVSATSIKAGTGGVIVAGAGSFVSAPTVSATTISAGTVSATTVSASTVKAGVVAVDPATGIVQGGVSGLVPFLVSGAAQTQYEYFRSSAAAGSLASMIGVSSYAGAIGGSVTSGGGTGTTTNDLAYVHLAPPVGDAKTAPAHSWLTNTGSGNGVPGLRTIAQLSRAGNLTLSAGDSGVTAGGGQLFAAGVNSVGTISGAAGLNLVGVATVTAGVSSAGPISGGAGLYVVGNAVATSTVSADTISGNTVRATNVNASGTVSGLKISGTNISGTNISAALNVTVGGALGVGGDVTVGGTLNAGLVLANTVSATTVSGTTVNAGTVNAAVAVNGLNAAFTGSVSAVQNMTAAVVTATTLVSAPTISATGTVYANTVQAASTVNAPTVNASTLVSSATVSASTMKVLVGTVSTDVGATLGTVLSRQQPLAYMHTIATQYAPSLAGLPKSILCTFSGANTGRSIQFPTVPANTANGYECTVRTFFGGAGGGATLIFPSFVDGNGDIQTTYSLGMANNKVRHFRIFGTYYFDYDVV